MVNSADEARSRARQGAAAQRLVNELVPQALIEACERGATSARVDLDPLLLKPAAGRLGRLHGIGLCEALEDSEQPILALACRKFLALGFGLSTVLTVEMQDQESPGAGARRLQVDHLVLDFSAAPDAPASSSNPLLQGVSLPHAAHWRGRAEANIMVRRMAHAALGLIDVAASRGDLWCRVAWRDLSSAPLQQERFDSLIAELCGRGFQVALIEAGTALRVTW